MRLKFIIICQRVVFTFAFPVCPLPIALCALPTLCYQQQIEQELKPHRLCIEIWSIVTDCHRANNNNNQRDNRTPNTTIIIINWWNGIISCKFNDIDGCEHKIYTQYELNRCLIRKNKTIGKRHTICMQRRYQVLTVLTLGMNLFAVSFAFFRRFCLWKSFMTPPIEWLKSSLKLWK